MSPTSRSSTRTEKQEIHELWKRAQCLLSTKHKFFFRILKERTKTSFQMFRTPLFACKGSKNVSLKVLNFIINRKSLSFHWCYDFQVKLVRSLQNSVFLHKIFILSQNLRRSLKKKRFIKKKKIPTYLPYFFWPCYPKQNFYLFYFFGLMEAR